jgi:hypothetical protein
MALAHATEVFFLRSAAHAEFTYLLFVGRLSRIVVASCPEPSSSTRRDKHEDYRYTAYETAALQIHMKHVAIVHP